MKITILLAIISAVAVASSASSIARGPENGQKQEIPASSPGAKVETSASEQGQSEPLKVETSASEQGQQNKIETSARQQGPDNEDLGDDAKMENMLSEPEEAKAESHVNVFNEEAEAEAETEEHLEEGNADLEEELANANQIFGPRWPYGKFAMPRPASGCPRGFRIGSRYQDNEDTSNTNSKSVGVETRMNVIISTNLRMNYCVKTTSGPFSPRSWPAGRYCIARRGGRCPGGFRTGSVYWDDEDNRNTNSKFGTLPDGVYNSNTKIYYCCRSDGSTSRAIRLPTTNNFYLYRYGSSCQRVSGMRVYTDTIYTDDEDNRNNNRCTGSHPAGRCGRNIRLYFCYYYKYR